MTISAKVILDSVSSNDIRLTTLQLRYPRMIHSEFMTHRVFSRNASSSRAIPVERLIEDVERDPATPVWWGKNQAGMQAREELSDVAEWPIPDSPRQQAIWRWKRACAMAVEQAREMHKLGAHKQIVNRIIESYCHINVVVTATEWANFFALRCHPDAQPEMRALAEAMREAMAASTPTLLKADRRSGIRWHVPYVDWDADGKRLNDHLDLGGRRGAPETALIMNGLIRLSVARCARVSYLTHEGKEPTIEADLALYDRLMAAEPLHASPAEHQALPDVLERVRDSDDDHFDLVDRWAQPELHGNFTGWVQYRKTLPNEAVRDR